MSAPILSTGFSALGNGVGFLYIVDTDGATILSSMPNDVPHSVAILSNALTAAPFSGEILASGTVTINVGGGTVTTCTVNGVDVMGVVAASGATPALIATDLASKINTTASTPNYTATVVGSGLNIVQITPAVGTGSLPNGFVVSAGVTAPTTVTTANMNGGVDGSGLFSPIFGTRTFINPLPTATEGVLAGATEITPQISKRGLESQLYYEDISISSGIISPERGGSVWNINLDTEGAAASDSLDTISVESNIQNGDIVIIKGVNSARITTINHGTGNIYLTNNTNYSTGGLQNQIMLQYLTPTGGTNGWYEVSRSAQLLDVANLRSQGVSEPVQGVNSTAMAVSGTTTYAPGTDKGYQVITGSPVLVGGVVFTQGGSPIDGDYFTLDYRATPTLGGNTVTIFGITLTTTQANQKCVVITKYRTANTTWYSTLYVNGNAIDFATTTQLATKENSLPASGGDTYVLQKTIAGAYSFVPNNGNTVLYSNATDTGTAADTAVTTLKTYTIPASTLSANGDYVLIRGVYGMAANANAKQIYFELDDGSTLYPLIDTASIVLNGLTFICDITVTRITETSMTWTAKMTSYTTATDILATATSFGNFNPSAATDFTVDIILNMVGTNGVAAANDIVARQFSVDLYKLRG